MNEPQAMRILVVGAGATGGFYGGLLARAGREVTFLLRDRRAAQIRAEGLHLALFQGDAITLHPQVLTAAELRQQPKVFDLILISTKSYQLAQAMEDFEPAVGPDTMLLPILNGMRHLQELQSRFPETTVLGGSVRIMSFLDENGRVVQMNELDQLNYGELSGERTPRVLAVDVQMSGAGFTNALQPDIVATMWQKWTVLASLGAICILGRGDSAQIASVPHGEELARAVIDECAAIATRNGYPPPPELVAMHVGRMTAHSQGITSSLYRDMLSGSPVEADHILGDLLARAEKAAVPLLRAAYVQLKVYEAARDAAARGII